MSEKHFIALADQIRANNRLAIAGYAGYAEFTYEHIDKLAEFCKAQNRNFNRERWLGYIADTCGPNGGPRD